MGRRSINTTKSGKYMNPTDQARKEARKKELKKNKKQRQMVRAAVLKNKDPSQILEEMEKIDEMEYNVLQPSPLNEKVLRDKRKKLKETFERVMRLYQTEEPELWSDLKRKEIEYEKKRLKKQQYYESVKHAQSVQVDEIPLPSSTQAPPTAGSIGFGATRLPPPPSTLSLPPFAPGAPPNSLKRLDGMIRLPESSEITKAKDKAGVPVGPPPNLFDMSELDTDAEDDEVVLKKYVPKSKRKPLPKPNSLQQRMLAISGQNIDDFMKEMENVHKKKEKERQAAKRRNQDKSDDDDEDEGKGSGKGNLDLDEDLRSPPSSRLKRFSDSDDEDSDESGSEKRDDKDVVTTTSSHVKPPPISQPSGIPPVVIPLPPTPAGAPPPLPIVGPPLPPVGNIPPPMMYRPPPMRPPAGMQAAFGIRMPPGPPSVPRPRPPGIPAPPPRMGIRMPPGPPPGLPPRMAQLKPQAPANPTQPQQPAPASAALNKDPSKGVTTITAKPQIRNLSADVTRFVPSTLRVKRDETRKTKPSTKSFAPEQINTSAEATKAATKDDAYLQFMNEMQGLL